MFNSGNNMLDIKAFVKPGAKKDSLSWVMENSEIILQINVKTPPVKGKANKSIIKLIKKELRRKAILVKGKTSSVKILRIETLTA